MSVELVQDLNPTTASLSIYDKEPVGAGGSVVLWTERGLFLSDGSAAGTTLVRDGWYSATTAAPQFTRVNDQVYFTAYDTQGGPLGLWRTDGTADGTVKLTETTAGFSLSEAGGSLYLAQVSGNASRLYRFDPATNTPVLLKQFTSYYAPGGITAYGGKVYFAANGSEGTGMWSTDGTPGGTTFVKAMYTSSGNPFGGVTVAGGLMYFSAYESGLGLEPWRSDGTAAGTYKLRELSSGSSSSFPRNFIELNATTALFVANGNLFRTQGTSATTTRIVPTDPDSPYEFGDLTRAAGTIFATATQYYSGKELWKTDGTNAGTVRVKDISPGSYSGGPGNLFALGNRLLFGAYDYGRGVGGLWTSDGTDAGTVLAVESKPGMSRRAYVVSGPHAFFDGVDPVYGNELHVTDGSQGGTRLVRDLNTTPNSSNPTRALSFGGNYYVTASTPTHTGWFRSDGTTATPIPAPAGGVPSPYNAIQPHMTTWNGAGYFFGEDANAFYRIDPSGVTPLSGIAHSAGGKPMFQPFGDRLFFPGRPGNYYTMFATDGTPGGTAPFGVNMSSVTGVAAGGGSLYFAGVPSGFGSNPTLWKSDGTTAGTTPLLTWTPNVSYSTFQHLTWFNGALYFMWTELSGNSVVTNLYRTDGTTAPTIVKQFGGWDDQTTAPFIAGGKMLFGAGAYSSTGLELWASDGTPEGTQLLKDIHPGNDKHSVPRFLAAAGDGTRAYFTATDAQHGEELWVTDGTAAGTTRLTDINPGTGDSMVYDGGFQPRPDPNTFAVVGGRLFFNAKEGEGVRELWETDGTPAGTRRVTNFGAGQYDPGPLAVGGAGDQAVLFAGTGPQGRELYRAAVDPVVPPAPAWLSPGSAATWDAGTKTLSVTGQATIVADPGADAPLITANGSAAVLTINPSSGRAVHVGGLTLTGGATATLASVTSQGTATAVTLDSSTLKPARGGAARPSARPKPQLTSIAAAALRTAADSRVLVVNGNTFNIDASSKLDLADNNLILNYSGASPAAGVEGMIKAGFNGGDWLGKRITSSAANANRSFALAVSDNSRLVIPFNDTRPFAGEPVDTTAVLVKFTHRVDLDLDGVITTNDATIFNSNYSEGAAARWGVGDVDFDELFTSNDATLFNSYYDESLGAV